MSSSSMDRGGHSRDQLNRILASLLVGDHEQHQVFPGGRGRGHMRKNLNEINMWPVVADEHGEHNVFPDADQRPVAGRPGEAPANPQPPMAALTADEENLALSLALGSAVGLPQHIEREALNRVIVPATVDAGLVPTMELVDNVFPDADQRPVAAPPVEAPANPQPPMVARTADEENLALLLALSSAVGLPQQIEREASIRVIVPATVDTGLVPTVGLVDNGDGSGLTLTPTLEVHVGGQLNKCR